MKKIYKNGGLRYIDGNGNYLDVDCPNKVSRSGERLWYEFGKDHDEGKIVREDGAADAMPDGTMCFSQGDPSPRGKRYHDFKIWTVNP